MSRNIIAQYPSSSYFLPSRRESVRQQRIESEQRRRDDLRRHYDQLRDVLPPQQVRLSKVSILAKGSYTHLMSSLLLSDCIPATEYIRELEVKNSHEVSKVENLTAEITRLRQVHDTLIARALPQLHLSEY